MQLEDILVLLLQDGVVVLVLLLDLLVLLLDLLNLLTHGSVMLFVDLVHMIAEVLPQRPRRSWLLWRSTRQRRHGTQVQLIRATFGDLNAALLR